jgi:hypothetical protein
LNWVEEETVKKMMVAEAVGYCLNWVEVVEIVKKMMVAEVLDYCLNLVVVEVALAKKKMAAEAVHHRKKLFAQPLR